MTDPTKSRPGLPGLLWVVFRLRLLAAATAVTKWRRSACPSSDVVPSGADVSDVSVPKLIAYSGPWFPGRASSRNQTWSPPEPQLGRSVADRVEGVA